MQRVLNLVKMLFSKKQAKESESAEELRIAFKGRYHAFKLLLNANNRALDVMAEMEAALKGTWPFGMHFVRSRCTRVSTDVFQIVKNLNDLTPEKYKALFTRFKEIQMRINPFIRPKSLSLQGPFTIPMEQVDKSTTDQVGSKLANLGEIRKQFNVHVPKGYAITARAYEHFVKSNELQEEIDRRIQSADVSRLDQLYSLSASIQQLIIGSAVPEDLAKTILEQFQALEKEGEGKLTVALRSSALGEDLPGTSFAGQYRSELNVSRESLLQAYKEVVASKYSLTAMSYRLNRGIRDEDVAMCVGCLQMVKASSGGVMYSRNPVQIRDDSVLVNAIWGLPKSVVDGSLTPDVFLISKGEPFTIRKKQIAVKDQKFVCYPDEGVCRLDITGEESRMPSLSDEQALDLAQLAVRLEEYYRSPQDIEWAVAEDGTIILLQCRPLQQLDEGKGRSQEGGEEVAPVIIKGGSNAAPGVGSGPVFIIRKDMDALQFPEGGVLVASQSLPRWATLLNRAAAVVTEQGSMTGHLANVAREFRVPALLGVRGAMDHLENGQLVTVDADGLTVYAGKVEGLLKKDEKPRNLMEGSPVYDALKGASEEIIPLRLLDPVSPNFRPEQCRTFHDITRFCHEKAVHEMFQFGKEHHFPERASKQLLCEVPMQWWVLNLDDGFREEAEGKYAKLENIVSIPMLAIWEGISAKPWEGPPPVDGKGLMSVMFEATRNTALVPGVRSKYGDRNYFMISKNYCSLSSRLGFHFSTIEALVSERARENYISFQFKGGAADFERRYRRIVFIKEMLEEYDFRTDVREDNLIARIEDQELEYMKARLRVLGFLTIHTRQLDMIMSNSAALNRYRAKITTDIQTFFQIH
jgi:pyruvate, water dikinase